VATQTRAKYIKPIVGFIVATVIFCYGCTLFISLIPPAATPSPRAATAVIPRADEGEAVSIAELEGGAGNATGTGEQQFAEVVTATFHGVPTAAGSVTHTATPSRTATATATPTIRPTATRTAAPTATATTMPVAPAATVPTITATTLPVAADSTPPPAIGGEAGELALVVRIIDGDTIEVRIGNQNYRVRYIGMDTPERGQPFFYEASEANRQLVQGQTVTLVRDVSETDRYGRLLRYVYLEEGTFVNAELVRLGFAMIATFPPDVKYQSLFLALQQEAREAGRGLWGLPPATSIPTPQPTTAGTPTVAPQPTSIPPTAVPTQPPAGTITLISLTSPISPGANATLVIEAAPGAVCDPGVIYKSGESTAQGLQAKTAGANGRLSWTWRVGTNTTPGTWVVYVVCNPGGRAQWDFVVH
jgi:endonuclease YncB( thermonuclease family)